MLSYYRYTPLLITLNMIRLIQVAILSWSADSFTHNWVPWKLKTICQCVVDVWTGNMSVIISWPRCQRHSLYLARVLHIRWLRSADFDISIRLGRVGRILWVWSITTKASRSLQIQWRIHPIFTHHENHTPWYYFPRIHPSSRPILDIWIRIPKTEIIAVQKIRRDGYLINTRVYHSDCVVIVIDLPHIVFSGI